MSVFNEYDRRCSSYARDTTLTDSNVQWDVGIRSEWVME